VGVAFGLWEEVLLTRSYLFQSVVEDHELRLQLERVGLIDPVAVLEQLQLQEDRDQLERSVPAAPDQLERLHDERL
jgi:hypothetical protein